MSGTSNLRPLLRFSDCPWSSIAINAMVSWSRAPDAHSRCFWICSILGIGSAAQATDHRKAIGLVYFFDSDDLKFLTE
jgi:hypothetical protein